MKVVLLREVKSLGKEGDVKEVSDGYARNYLIPRGLAVEATSVKLKELKEKSERKDRKLEREEEKAKTIKGRIDGQVLSLKVKAGEGGRLFGTVTAKDISDTLQKEFGVTVDKKRIEISEPIKHLGEYRVKIKLFPSISADIIVVLQAD
ncbi:50S ribosomal protein L9 [Syntrophothermus lipocalidus]|uniref:Large ribosomal subunit protein bL9 n=1 Tax=Syntrophothermus lipocalidus (strain DSM 12680 / TGB-C1) TaxID=643648 RepID=D7CK98_SYNLT|nr:50S ribosomal protein L9 [Syntrophothermus lipocalidus]ADI03082.1 ribosomal protein L9 [Syntrophothermus lipocalidus DSM 12680]